ncbi:MAG: 50S ribosomal protein L29 [Candidatus Buchananbacteria bacterium RIFCSPLOWO2_01_FULL_46_12]|uniref:Large ribosomal subunit protein uL29 n=2 Tax=Candidatus Buchananiibacteriota TaxID=1817903 RepID=A0A1G1YR88_9BACT|nr:MAG: 50S ribosomal protein L29 [Candidatus Buchananbacteria bacterium RIFCSPHIGHO2_01_FULL_44_11]OGY54841.1 MAG: 50S ribosomal protein L29 [Candidatus Buchananbacteria bacterium RIFCSPLOWO2_01_FULL_46_12]
MEFKELKTKSPAELQKLLAETREKLRQLRFKVASKQLKNVREIREAKKIITHVLFLLSQATDNLTKNNSQIVEEKNS